MRKRKICVVTGTRAEYGLLYWLMKRIQSDPDLKLQIVVTGMHLSHEFGLTYKQIEDDGFHIDEKVDMLLSSDTEVAITKSIGMGIIGIAGVLHKLKPDLVVLLGDRFEIFSAAITAFIAKIPIAHIHGGELTEGLIDDAIRHSITKMSYLHFVSTDKYRRRVIQLGEQPNRVFCVGALGIDSIRKLKLLSKKQLENEINFKFGVKNIFITFHPVTLEKNTSEIQFKELLGALDYFQDINIIFSKPNADTYGRVIIGLIEDYVSKNQDRAVSFDSMGQLKYLSTIQYVDMVLGNSSSGIIEVPSFGKPTINIGDRQRGRIKAVSIIDCKPEKRSIIKALKKAFSPDFKLFCAKIKNPYEGGSTTEKIAKIIKQNVKKINDVKKNFYDIGIKI